MFKKLVGMFSEPKEVEKPKENKFVDVNYEFTKHFFNDKTAEGRKVLMFFREREWISEMGVSGIALFIRNSDKSFRIKTPSSVVIPDYVYMYAKKYLESKGYTDFATARCTYSQAMSMLNNLEFVFVNKQNPNYQVPVGYKDMKTGVSGVKSGATADYVYVNKESNIRGISSGVVVSNNITIVDSSKRAREDFAVGVGNILHGSTLEPKVLKSRLNQVTVFLYAYSRGLV